LKLIFSRKGIDDAYGKGASPIFPDGRMVSIPIPVKGTERGIPYRDIKFGTSNFQHLIIQLNLPIHKTVCHFDPDLQKSSIKRHKNWKPCLGHHGAAATHLLNQEVSPGDIFLFFGTFRQVEMADNKKWTFLSVSVKRHIIFAYLRIGQILDLRKTADRKEAVKLGYGDHPHLINDYPKTNVLFVASNTNRSSSLFKFDRELVLSQDNQSKSTWELPLFFNDLTISRHGNQNRFSIQHNKTILKTVGIGQDFVVQENQDVKAWVYELIDKHGMESNGS